LEVERGESRDRARHPDRGRGAELGEQLPDRCGAGLELVLARLLARRVRVEEPLRQADTAEVEARSALGGNQLGRAPADVEHQRRRVERAAVRDAAPGQLRLFLAGEQPRVEAVAPFDLTEEGLAVVGVANR